MVTAAMKFETLAPWKESYVLITEEVIFSLFLGLVSFKALIEESEMKKFPDNDLLRHLRLVTQDAEKCASVAQQLLNGKRQTR